MFNIFKIIHAPPDMTRRNISLYICGVNALLMTVAISSCFSINKRSILCSALRSSLRSPSSSEPSRRFLFGSSQLVFLASSSYLTRPYSYLKSAIASVPSSSLSSEESSSNPNFYADTSKYPSFRHLGVQSEVLLERLARLGYTRPSAVQAAVFSQLQVHDNTTANTHRNFVIGAETGSGKTLSYLLPLVDDILIRKQRAKQHGNTHLVPYDYARAIILVPNKELAQQILRMACGICADHPSQCVVWGINNHQDENTRVSSATNSPSSLSDPSKVVRIAVLPGNLYAPTDFKPFRDAFNNHSPPVDLLICTPAALGPWGLTPKCVQFFIDVETLIVDEADMLLDGGFKRDLDCIFQGFRRADRLDTSAWEEEEQSDESTASATTQVLRRETNRSFLLKTQHVFVGATIPNYGLKSVDVYIDKKFPKAQRVMMTGMHHARHNGLCHGTLWLEDSIAEEGVINKKRMETLVTMLKGQHETVNLREEKVMIFLNSIDDVDGATNALGRAGIPAMPYHAKVPLTERYENLERFRKYVAKDNNTVDISPPVLVCTDLASRGLDIPGVTAIVQLQFAGNVVAHLHRMGRCGRAGERNGRGIIFYSPGEKKLVDVVREAEMQQDKRMMLQGDVPDDDEVHAAGTVSKAFSRRRGFTKKIKKTGRQEQVS